MPAAADVKPRGGALRNSQLALRRALPYEGGKCDFLTSG